MPRCISATSQWSLGLWVPRAGCLSPAPPRTHPVHAGTGRDTPVLSICVIPPASPTHPQQLPRPCTSRPPGCGRGNLGCSHYRRICQRHCHSGWGPRPPHGPLGTVARCEGTAAPHEFVLPMFPQCCPVLPPLQCPILAHLQSLSSEANCAWQPLVSLPTLITAIAMVTTLLISDNLPLGHAAVPTVVGQHGAQAGLFSPTPTLPNPAACALDAVNSAGISLGDCGHRGPARRASHGPGPFQGPWGCH